MFYCFCPAIDEVLEPAPATVDCWACKRPLAMKRIHRAHEPPAGSARFPTAEEAARVG